jgi:hypothetical protein
MWDAYKKTSYAQLFQPGSDVRKKLSQWDPTNSPKYTQAAGPDMPTAGQSAQDINAMKAALGVGSPIDTRDASRAAVMGQLDQAGHGARAMSDQAMSGRGLYRSGMAGANLDRINTDLAGQKAMAEMGIQQDFANRTDAANVRDMQAALGMHGQQSQNAMNTANFGADQHAMAYQQNQLAPWQNRQMLLGQGLGMAQNQANQFGNMAMMGPRMATQIAPIGM